MFSTLALLGSHAHAQNPYNMPDESWLSLSGTVVGAGEESFRLDYGDGIVTVEMDDWDSYGDAYMIKDGDRVTVYGKVDDDMFEVTSIEAGSVYVENLSTFFHASAMDEETMARVSITAPLKLGEVSYIGMVTSVQPDIGKFTIGKGDEAMTIDILPLPYNPLDNEGYQQIEEGDLVSVSGYIDKRFFGAQELNAKSVMTLENA